MEVMKAKGKLKTSRHVWKPTVVPDGFILVIDTRERKPFFTPLPKGLTAVRLALDRGDYSVLGFERFVAVERKQLSDFLQYVGKDRLRTIGKLESLKSCFWAGLVVECSEEDLYVPEMCGSCLSPEHIRGFLKSLRVRYGVHFYCNRDRAACERWVLDSLAEAYKVLREPSGQLERRQN